MNRRRNVFDVIMVGIGYTIFVPDGGNTNAIRAVRVVRALRPLRTIAKVNALREVVSAVLSVSFRVCICLPCFQPVSLSAPLACLPACVHAAPLTNPHRRIPAAYRRHCR